MREDAIPSPESESDCVLAIDPGSAKCGFAVVRADGEILHRAVVPTERMKEEASALTVRFAPLSILVGVGTGAKPALRALESLALSVPVLPVEEAHTSEMARARFVAENPAQGWQRLLPRSLRTPTRPYDDYVAVILAERYWQSLRDSS